MTVDRQGLFPVSLFIQSVSLASDKQKADRQEQNESGYSHCRCLWFTGREHQECYLMWLRQPAVLSTGHADSGDKLILSLSARGRLELS
jgi:hypothetical protein